MKTYTLTVNDFCNAQSLHTGWKVWILLAFMMVSTYFFVAVNARNHPDAGIGIFSIFGVMATVFLLVTPTSIKRNRRSMFYEHKRLQEKITLNYDDEGISWSSDSGSFRSKWENIPKYRIGKGVVLIYESSYLMRIVPQRVFSEAELNDLRSKLENRGDNQTVDTTAVSTSL